MKATLLASLLLGGLGAQAQIPGRSIKQYITRMGTVLHVGDTISFGTGRREDGAFKYASVPTLGDAGSLPKTWNHRRVVIKDPREIPYKTGPVVAVVFKSGIYNAKLDADSAEEFDEILTAANRQKATPATSGGVADELLKLKKLLDAGALTQAEFDAQKAKLLK